LPATTVRRDGDGVATGVGTPGDLSIGWRSAGDQLEQQDGAGAADQDGDGRITLGRDFDTEARMACREFRRQERRAAAASTDNGIACRAGDGSWTVMLVPGAS